MEPKKTEQGSGALRARGLVPLEHYRAARGRYERWLASIGVSVVMAPDEPHPPSSGLGPAPGPEQKAWVPEWVNALSGEYGVRGEELAALLTAGAALELARDNRGAVSAAHALGGVAAVRVLLAGPRAA